MEYNWKSANADLLMAALNVQDLMMNERNDQIQNASNYTKIIKRAISIAVPKRRRRDGRIAVYWWSKELGELHKKCNTHRRKYMRARKEEPGSVRTEEWYNEWKNARDIYRKKK